MDRRCQWAPLFSVQAATGASAGSRSRTGLNLK